MDAKISPAFWDDMEEHPYQMKLTVLWAMTNSSRDSCGVFRRSPARFAFQTGLDATWLNETIDRLPRMFVEDGERVLLRNFIRYQIGVGQALARDNQAKGLHKGFKLLSPRLQNAILETYPELKALLSPYQALPANAKPLQTQADPALSTPHPAPTQTASLSQGLPEPYKKDRRERIGKVQGVQGEPGAGEPAVDEVVTRAGMIGLGEAEARAFYEHYAGLGWMYGNTPMAKWWHWLPRWKARAETHAAQKKPAPPHSPAAEELRRLDEALESEQDPQMRAELKKRRRELGGEK